MELFLRPIKWLYVSNFIYVMIIYVGIMLIYVYSSVLKPVRCIINNIIYNINDTYLNNRKHIPILLMTFYVITFLNILGFFGFPLILSNPLITLTLSISICLYSIIMGIRKLGLISFLNNLIPHGLPKFLYPLMIMIELATLLLKPFILGIRIYLINFISHMILHIFENILLSLFSFKLFGNLTSIGQGFLVLFLIIDIIKTLLQAYLFTLSIAMYLKICTESH